jgi:hypothetical protein
MSEDEPDAHALAGRWHADALSLPEPAWDVGDQHAVGRGGARHGGECGEQREHGDELSHPRVNGLQGGNLLGSRAR